MHKSFLAIAASAVGALSLFAAEPLYRRSNDGRNRAVAIVNQLPPDRGDNTRPFGSVAMIFATPRSGPTTILGDRLGIDDGIPPGEGRMVFFDDGYGACEYDVRFLTMNFDPLYARIDVCRTPQFVVDGSWSQLRMRQD